MARQPDQCSKAWLMPLRASGDKGTPRRLSQHFSRAAKLQGHRGLLGAFPRGAYLVHFQETGEDTGRLQHKGAAVPWRSRPSRLNAKEHGQDRPPPLPVGHTAVSLSAGGGAAATVVWPHSLDQQIFAEGHFQWVLTMRCGHKWSRRPAPALKQSLPGKPCP